MKIKSKEKQSVTINIRAKPRQRDLIDRAADTLGKNRSDFMLETTCREAEFILMDKRAFVVDDKTYAEFLTLLDAPRKENPKLRTLLNSKSPWKK